MLSCMQHIVIDGVIFGLQKSGGISRLWAEILLGLNENFSQSHAVTLLLPKNANVEWQRIAPKLRHVRILKRKRFRWNKRGFLRDSLYVTFLAGRLRPQVWHSSFYVGLPFRFGGKKILFLHDMIPEVMGFASDYERAIKYRSLKECDRILAISNHSRKDLLSYWPDFATKSSVVPISCGMEEERSLRMQPARESYFVFVGKRSGYKNFVSAIREILKESRLKTYHIYVVGGEETWNHEEKALIEEFHAQKRVHLKGMMEFSELREIILNARALLYPSLYEGFGLPILEAFCQRIPVLACRTSSIPEVTGNSYPLADPNKPQTFVSTLLELLKNREKWISYGEERAKLFSRDKLVQALSDVYAL